MAKSYEAPPGVDIAALRTKQKNTAMDLMRPGEGTPWEDRGAIGTPKAFLGTCVRSITSPALLLDHIRRPDTTHEASAFAYGCSALWVVSTAIHMVLYNVMFPPKWKAYWEQTVGGSYDTQFYIKTVVLSVLTGGAVYLLCVMFAKRMYYAMVSTELKNNAPRVLIHNIFCYCLGPSLLSLIPVAGPPLAILMIFLAWCAAGAKRLYISWRGAIVAAVLTMAASLIIFGAGFFLANMVMNQIVNLVEPPPEPEGGFDPVYGKSKG